MSCCCCVTQRTGAGEAEAAGDAKPSCFTRFNSLTAFKNFLEGKSAKSAAASTHASSVVMGAAAAVGVLLLVL